jgi:hypothetical protein
MPLTTVVLVEILFPSDAIALAPLVIVAVVVSFVTAAWLAPPAQEVQAPSAPADPRAAAPA